MYVFKDVCIYICMYEYMFAVYVYIGTCTYMYVYM